MASYRLISSFASRTLLKSPRIFNNLGRSNSLPGGSNQFIFNGFNGTKSQNIRYMSSSVINLSDFEATEKFTQLNHKSVLYFTATWCPPCKAIKPVYEELSSKHSDIAFGKIDVDENSDAALEFNITSVPTFVFFDGEDIMQRFSGADRTMLEKLLQELEERK
ncbi:thioredoxin [Nitzschia inconspicua]|uniref:Thioredoxin n=1 Tax=Nitzschia inconspicua TaxID=303405 RepID=A0A9K3LX56_9STRA|nr:thioredoxin [Nitzschia inconspicua]